MDIATGASLFGLLDQSLGLLKKARDVMPESKEKRELTRQLAEVEAAYRIAEAKSAQELGYELCKCTWPPQIMLVSSQGHSECPKCKRQSGKSSSAGASDALDPEELKILQHLSGSASSASLDEICIHTGLGEQRAKYWLSKLAEKGLVRRNNTPMVGALYALKQAGRELLMSRGLL